MRAALYARVSSEEQAEKGTSLQTQVDELRRRAEYEKWKVYHEYIDDGISGTTDDRKELKQLISDAGARRFDIVAVTKLDRFFRNLRLLLQYVEKLEQSNVKFVSIGENFSTENPQGKFTLQILGVIAEFERERIKERSMMGRRARISQGKWACGNALYGYKYNPTTKILDISEDEASIVRRIFNLYVYDRLGHQQIARMLNKDGVKPRQQGKIWYNGAIKDIIKHPGYKGEHKLGIQIPTIIAPTVWDLAQQRRKDNRRLHRRNGSQWLLQGNIRCGLCGHVLACGRAHNVRRVYSCRGRLQLSNVSNSAKCQLRPIDAEWLETAVWQKVSDALSNPESLMQSLNEYINQLEVKQKELEQCIKPVDERLKIIADSEERLGDIYYKRVISKEKFDEEWKKLQSEREQLESMRLEIDPKQIEELTITKGWLDFWVKEKRRFDLHMSFVFEDEPDKELQKRKIAARYAESILSQAELEYEDTDNVVMGPTTKRQLLDRFHFMIITYQDRIEIKAQIPIENIQYQVQENNPDYR